jgi:transcriptional regulator with XRE-family HTH domain
MQAKKITINEVSAKLRSIRRARGLSLAEVELLSDGQIKAVVLGSYERGTRALSVKRAIEIANLYEIPVSQLFSEKKPNESTVEGRRVLDLRIISSRAQIDSPWRERFELLARFSRGILESRQDWNGQVLSIRGDDCRVLALLLNIESEELLRWLDSERVLLAIR